MTSIGSNKPEDIRRHPNSKQQKAKCFEAKLPAKTDTIR